jgi:branched-chain amino acid transport system permease protein
MAQALINGVFLGSLFTLVALGLTLVYGIMGVPNFAQAGVMVLAAYAAWTLQTAGAPFLIAACVAVVVAGLLSVLTEVVAYRWIRDKPAAAPAVALGLALILQNVALLIWGGEGKALNTPYDSWLLQVAGLSISGVKVVVVLVTVVATAILAVVLNTTSFGRSIRAVAQDRDAAGILGVAVKRQYTLAFFIAGLLSGLAAVVFAPTYQISPFMADDLLLSAFVVVVMGGLGSIPGAVLGGLGLGIIQSLGGAFISQPYQSAFGFILLVLILVVRPAGIRALSAQRVG